ncbi:hypothetical protein EMCRGX_G021154 [Ephydatia muelleri]
MAEVSYSGYGKNAVRVMRVKKNGSHYSICEFDVKVQLQLATDKDYTSGDNSDVVATDTMKNTVYVLAKNSAYDSPEQFALILCSHFLDTCKQVVRVTISIEQAPWERMRQGGVEHNHAFIFAPLAVRFCNVTHKRGSPPVMYAGIQNMKVFKATQSGFENFFRDRFTTLPDSSDRAFCTEVYCKYLLEGSLHKLNYDTIWASVRDSLLDTFAGPPSTGTYSPSVQNTMFQAAKSIFGKVQSITSVDIQMPNVHHFTADLSKLHEKNNGELLLPSKEPHGMITATFSRPKSKL